MPNPRWDPSNVSFSAAKEGKPKFARGSFSSDSGVRGKAKGKKKRKGKK